MLTDEQIRAQVKAYYDKATPEEIAAMLTAQRESFVRAMAPCEHGVLDFETCPDCLAAYRPEQRP